MLCERPPTPAILYMVKPFQKKSNPPLPTHFAYIRVEKRSQGEARRGGREVVCREARGGRLELEQVEEVDGEEGDGGEEGDREGD